MEDWAIPEMHALAVEHGKAGGAALAAKGYQHSDEVRARIADGNRGKSPSTETRAKIGARVSAAAQAKRLSA